MKVFITGGTGFIGSRIVDQLLERGDQVYVLVRSKDKAEFLRQKGAYPVNGDILDKESMRTGMQGAQLVFHVAGHYKVGSRQKETTRQINVDGTRNVLALAQELKIPRIVYTSTLAVLGDTHGQMVDETYRKPDEQSFPSEYHRTKWQAHYEIAVPHIEQGAPITIVMPGAVYGPGDASLIGQLMTLFRHGFLPVLPGPDTSFCYAHVEDVARAHLLAAEIGRAGEAYVTAGPAYSLKDMAAIWAEVTDIPKPLIDIPADFLKPFSPLVDWLSQWIPLPDMISSETIDLLGETYIARSGKAEKELSWGTRDVKEGMRETFATMAAGSTRRWIQPSRRTQAAGLALISSVLLLFGWLLFRRKK